MEWYVRCGWQPSNVAVRLRGCPRHPYRAACLRGGPPACVMVYGCPAMLMVPVRVAPVVFVASVYRRRPSPLPLAPALMVIHPSLDDAVHPQAESVKTLKLPVVPVTSALAEVAESVKLQPPSRVRFARA